MEDAGRLARVRHYQEVITRMVLFPFATGMLEMFFLHFNHFTFFTLC